MDLLREARNELVLSGQLVLPVLIRGRLFGFDR